MMAKLLKILRRDAERAVKIEEKESSTMTIFHIVRNKICIYYDSICKAYYFDGRKKLDSLLKEYRRNYILEKLEKLK